MKKQLLFLVRYFLFWLVYFSIARIIFLIYNFRFTVELEFIEFSKILLHGLHMDLSASGYMSLFPGLIIVINSFLNISWIKSIINIYTIIFFSLISILIFSDIELYHNWGFRMDTTPLLYLKMPSFAFASVSIWLILLLIGLDIIFVYLVYVFYKRFIIKSLMALDRVRFISVFVLLIVYGSLIVPIRGGVGIATMNIGTVFFSANAYSNHASINILWNIMYSIVKPEKNSIVKKMPEKESQEIFMSLTTYSKESREITLKENPNVVILILESFTAKLIGELGGQNGVTPRFDSLCRDGILFTEFYANGDRSDKGLVSILSGYPAQPTSSVIKFPSKVRKLPGLCELFQNRGYNTSFYYGGDLDFANMRYYISYLGFDNIITKNDFKRSQQNSKWGTHDHIVFQKLKQDMDKAHRPFLNVFFTLSSHEPFDVPMKSRFEGDEPEVKFKNSVAYTDSALGAFFDQAKKTSWWENTLFLIVADHGSQLPGYSPVYSDKKFHIPFLIVGGALNNKSQRIDRTACQTDIPATILNALNMNAEEFLFSKNILSEEYKPFAFYCFNNGYGYISGKNKIIVDLHTNKAISKSKGITVEHMKNSDALIQILTTNYNSL